MRRKWNAALIVVSLLILPSVPSLAAPTHTYPLTGKVLETNSGQARVHAYKIETGASVYKLLCYRRTWMFGMYAECAVNGKPLAVGDEVHLRAEGRTLFLESGNNKEQTLSVLLEEAKTLPPLPATAGTTGEGAVVLARGIQMSNQIGIQSSPTPAAPVPASSSTTIPTGPVVVVPSTGGTPVLVTPTAPVTGGIVTGIGPSGQPVTGVAASPINTSSSASPPLSGSASSTSGPAWITVLYLQTENRIYQVECSIGDCALSGRKLALGDLLVARIAGKWAYLTLASPNSQAKESKFRILSVTGTDEAPSSQPL